MITLLFCNYLLSRRSSRKFICLFLFSSFFYLSKFSVFFILLILSQWTIKWSMSETEIHQSKAWDALKINKKHTRMTSKGSTPCLVTPTVAGTSISFLGFRVLLRSIFLTSRKHAFLIFCVNKTRCLYRKPSNGI